MCGIVGAVSSRQIVSILLTGLKRLEYRGYDSAGIAVLDNQESKAEIRCIRRVGKVQQLADACTQENLLGTLGIAHTRWATHGAPTEKNAHPHRSGDEIVVVHNGVIENEQYLRQQLQQQGYQFESETDTEVIVHLLHSHLKKLPQGVSDNTLAMAMRASMAELEGAYAIAMLGRDFPGQLVVGRNNSPLVIGVGFDEHFIASDPLALQPVTDRFIYLEDGDVAYITKESVVITDQSGNEALRPKQQLSLAVDGAEKGAYRHYMLKEIYEQPTVVRTILGNYISSQSDLVSLLADPKLTDMITKAEAIQIIACGTSYHAGLVARYWFEAQTGLPCWVEIASEFRYRKKVILPNTLFITISQSGETADTLAALRQAKTLPYLGTIAICNVFGSALMRESDHYLLTHAGPEIGVASTKAFTAQLVVLYLFMVTLMKHQQQFSVIQLKSYLEPLKKLPITLEATLELDKGIADSAESFSDRNHALFLGRAAMYPIAMEGALKLKEISYIHAEAYAAGELKHGPLALIDGNMPVIALAPNDALLVKLNSNLQEVKARGALMYLIADDQVDISGKQGKDDFLLRVPFVNSLLAPMVFTLPLQLLAYHVGVAKGTDVDQPRNLAKSVTVE